MGHAGCLPLLWLAALTAMTVWERMAAGVPMKSLLGATQMPAGSGYRARCAACEHALAFRQHLRPPIARLVQGRALEQRERNRFERPNLLNRNYFLNIV